MITDVISRFIRHNEKELNPDLLKMTMYYDCSINVTNSFSISGKGFVKSNVKAHDHTYC